ncbi:MAG: leucine-rich repeat protein [Tannerella sp.]|uniref:leucine-rich repeat protein n=1 Tax=Tannerella sp. TaxID=2382127 RepID=UPI003FA2F397
MTQAGTAAATLSVTPGTINITAAGETKPLTVTASGAWTAASDQTWLTLSAASGTGDGSVNVTATANPGTSRTAKVTFTSGSITREVNVTQAGTAAATNGTTGPLNWSYDAGTKTLSITGTGDMPDFALPDDQPWTAFQNEIETVTIGSGVTTVGQNAFFNCMKLQNITLPEGVTTIGAYAFAQCHKLPGITIPSTVTAIGEGAFLRCYALPAIGVAAGNTHFTSADDVLYNHTKTELICYPYGKPGTAFTVPAEVKKIGRSAFADCRLQSITLPEGLTTIGVSAFLYCSALKNIKIPGSVTSMEKFAFQSCTALTDVTVAWDTPLAIEPTVYYDVTLSGVTLNVPADKVPAYQAANVWKDFGTITDSWITVNPASLDFTFAGETKPVTVNASRAWTAASDQTWLTLSASSGSGTATINVTVTANPGTMPRTAKVTFTSGSITREVNVIQAGTGAATIGTTGPLIWSHDAGTKTLSITGTGDMPDYASESDQPWYAFQDEIKTVTIGSGVTTVGENAFRNCMELQNITLPEGVTTIGERAFLECRKLAGITIPSTVTAIGKAAFFRCYALPAIGVAAGSAHFTSADGVLYNKAKTELVCYPRRKPGTAFTVPAGVKKIGGYAFGSCKLQSITLPEGLTTIGEDAFFRCSALKSVKIPGSVTSIENFAFEYCKALTDVTVAWDTPLAINPTVYEHVTLSGVTLNVPAGKGPAYQAANVWKDFGTITDSWITVNPASLDFTFAGETKPVTVNASGAWTAQCDASWLTLSAASGTGNNTITVTAPAYEDEQPRTAKIFFVSGALKETVTVTQNPKPGPAFVALDYTELTLPEGASQRLVVTAYPKDADIHRDVKWYSSNNDIATVSANGTVTALAPGSANITVMANVGGQQTACRVRVVPAEQMVSVASGSDNMLRLALMAPSDADFTLSFDVDLPEGFALDAKKTAPDPSLAASYTLTITGKHVEMKPNGLRSGGTMEKRDLLTLACTAAPGTSKGTYKAALRNLTFTPTAGYALQNITVPFTFTHTVANQTIDGLRVYAADGALHLTLPKAETVHIYNVVGSLVRTMNASAGDHVLPLSAGVYVVRVGECVTKILIK